MAACMLVLVRACGGRYSSNLDQTNTRQSFERGQRTFGFTRFVVQGKRRIDIGWILNGLCWFLFWEYSSTHANPVAWKRETDERASYSKSRQKEPSNGKSFCLELNEIDFFQLKRLDDSWNKWWYDRTLTLRFQIWVELFLVFPATKRMPDFKSNPFRWRFHFFQVSNTFPGTFIWIRWRSFQEDKVEIEKIFLGWFKGFERWFSKRNRVDPFSLSNWPPCLAWLCPVWRCCRRFECLPRQEYIHSFWFGVIIASRVVNKPTDETDSTTTTRVTWVARVEYGCCAVKWRNEYTPPTNYQAGTDLHSIHSCPDDDDDDVHLATAKCWSDSTVLIHLGRTHFPTTTTTRFPFPSLPEDLSSWRRKWSWIEWW